MVEDHPEMEPENSTLRTSALEVTEKMFLAVWLKHVNEDACLKNILQLHQQNKRDQGYIVIYSQTVLSKVLIIV